MIISIEGLIGVGKTTFISHFANMTNLSPCHESVEDNPFLAKFYEDQKRWAFTLQIYFLHDRYKKHTNKEGNLILDRSIYGDRCFANILYKDGLIERDEYFTYLELFEVFEGMTKKIDLCIHLHTSTEQALGRIKKRNRKIESDISLDYLNSLQSELEIMPSFLPKETRYMKIGWGDMTGEEIKNKVRETISGISLGTSFVS
jgi:deoxyadenosine/deoxycytidine kinase